MTPQTALELEFADGTYLFDLKLPQIAELQEKRKAGILTIYGRVIRGRFELDGEVIGIPHEGEAYAEDLFETIRLALIGGGRGLVDGQEVQVSALTAKNLVERYCHPMPLRDSWTLAAVILGGRILGAEPPKKEEPAKQPAGSEQTGQTSPKS